MSLASFSDLAVTERELWRAEQEAINEQCQLCGHPREECADEHRLWYPQREVCYATRERKAARALFAQMHEERPYHDGTWTSWEEKRSRSHPYHWSEGLTIWVAQTDVRPDDQFLSASAGGG